MKWGGEQAKNGKKQNQILPLTLNQSVSQAHQNHENSANDNLDINLMVRLVTPKTATVLALQSQISAEHILYLNNDRSPSDRVGK